jgi:thiol-disulfide isomerase/thioredoxin
MRKILAVLCFLLPLAAAAQTVKIVSYSQLEELVSTEKEKLLVVNFWATWCVPCVKELPAFEKLNAGYAEKNVRVVLVSIDYPDRLQNTLIPFLKKKKITAETLLLDEPNANQWIDKVSPSWSGSIPATLIVDAKTQKRDFYEREFTWEELETTVKNYLTR